MCPFYRHHVSDTSQPGAQGREEFPDDPFQVFCDVKCRAERTVDPATAEAIFVNVDENPRLESWV